MKTLFPKALLALTMSALMFFGCDKLEDADDVEVDIDLDHTFVIDEDLESDEAVFYADGGTIDATTNPNYLDYKDKIKDIRVDSILYTVQPGSYFAEGTVLFTGGMGSFYASAASADAFAEASLDFQDIAAAQGSTFKLDYSVDELEAIANQLETVDVVYFEVSGTFSHTPVAFNVPVTIYVTVFADAL